jgi:hypothetical protein
MSDTKYQIVIFNNKSKKRVIAASNIYNNIIKKYNKITTKSNVIFSTKYNKKKECLFEIAVVCIGKCKSKVLHRRDELGRLIEITTKNKKYHILKIRDFELEEKIYDHQQKKRIYFQELFGKYLSSTNIIQMYSLNNKIIIQNMEEFALFSLKNIGEARRFIEVVQGYFVQLHKSNCLFSKDLSTPQRKEIYNLLESKGFERSLLYKHYTY